MKILIIGGTQFVGRYLAETALKKGHDLTLFNRGKTNNTLFPEAQKLIGDRSSDIHLLEDGEWDAVIDTCGYLPSVVGLSAKALKKRTDKYVFISSVSVYEDFLQTGITESYPKALAEDPDSEDIRKYYGPLKALCENVVNEHYFEKSLIIRPGIIVGPHDPTGRFTYWVHRFLTQEKILIPDSQEAPFQFIHARDLAEWTIEMIENGKSGTFNATGPSGPMTFDAFFKLCSTYIDPTRECITVPVSFLDDHKIQQWTDLPLWTNPNDPQVKGIYAIDCSQAKSNGLVFTKTEDIIEDIKKWCQSLEDSEYIKTGISHDKEASLIESWLSK